MVSASLVQGEGMAAIVPAVDEGADGVDEVFDAGEVAAADGLVGNDAKKHERSGTAQKYVMTCLVARDGCRFGFG
jgi:hypothetical protein